ncbi:hypothetical protein HQ531_10460 [bacterium]|nr:hypothetical protein [bacterium]
MAMFQYHCLISDSHPKPLIVLALTAAPIYLLNLWFILPLANTPLFFNNYLGDFLALPIYLPVSLYLAAQLKIVPNLYRLHWIHVLGTIILFSVIFEGLVPVFDTRSTRDPFDLIAYFAGGILVYFTQTIFLPARRHDEYPEMNKF